MQQAHIITPAAWIYAPAWLTVREAWQLSGWDQDNMLEIIAEGGVDLNDAGLIAKDSLHEFQEGLALALHWGD